MHSNGTLKGLADTSVSRLSRLTGVRIQLMRIFGAPLSCVAIQGPLTRPLIECGGRCMRPRLLAGPFCSWMEPSQEGWDCARVATGSSGSGWAGGGGGDDGRGCCGERADQRAVWLVPAYRTASVVVERCGDSSRRGLGAVGMAGPGLVRPGVCRASAGGGKARGMGGGPACRGEPGGSSVVPHVRGDGGRHDGGAGGGRIRQDDGGEDGARGPAGDAQVPWAGVLGDLGPRCRRRKHWRDW